MDLKLSVRVPVNAVSVGALSATPTLIGWVGGFVVVGPVKVRDGTVLNDAVTDIVLVPKLLSPL